LQRTGCLYHGEFIGTPEDPGLIETIFELEQKLGKEILWVRGIGYDTLVDQRKGLPNKSWRFCTSETKLAPIFTWVYLNIDLGLTAIPPKPKKSKVNYWCTKPIKMGIGYRWDEAHRAGDFTDHYEMALRCLMTKTGSEKFSVFYNWRTAYTPLIDHEISYFQVNEWARGSGIPFVDDSNCQHCFYKPEQQLKRNLDLHPDIRRWAYQQEEKIGATFKSGSSIEEIADLALDPDFVPGGGSGCAAGICTD
jgi:hypothetical protein